MSEPVPTSDFSIFEPEAHISPSLFRRSRHRHTKAMDSPETRLSTGSSCSSIGSISSPSYTHPPSQALGLTLSSLTHSGIDSGFSAIPDTPFGPYRPPDPMVSIPPFPGSYPDMWSRSSRGRRQRVSRNDLLLEYSFKGQDHVDDTRRGILDRILSKDWYLNNDREPECGSSDDDVTLGLMGIGTHSVFTAFLDEHSKGQWKCAFGSVRHPCKRNMRKKTFDRIERAVDHVRSHLGHRPFICSGECGTQGW